MIVWRSTYEELEEKYLNALADLYRINEKYNERIKENIKLLQYKEEYQNLADKLNPKGGWNFVNNAVLLSQEDIQKLILLCHPDKHDGKPMANEMTQKLLKMRS